MGRRTSTRFSLGRRPGAVIGVLLSVAACGPSKPDVVWVPGEGFGAVLSISADLPDGRPLGVGEELVLHATRSSGPWQEVLSDTLADDACWLVHPPAPVETEVQATVRWMVDPAGDAAFNLPRLHDLFSRSVTFSKAGAYRLWAADTIWCGDPVRSETIVVVVGPAAELSEKEDPRQVQTGPPSAGDA